MRGRAEADHGGQRRHAPGGGASGRLPRGFLDDLGDFRRQDERGTPGAGRIVFHTPNALCLESAQPPAHRLPGRAQLLRNFLGALSRPTQQQHLRPLYQPPRQRAAARIALQIILLLTS